MAPNSTRYLSKWLITYMSRCVRQGRLAESLSACCKIGTYRYFLNLVAFLKEVYSPLQLCELFARAKFLYFLFGLKGRGYEAMSKRPEARDTVPFDVA